MKTKLILVCFFVFATESLLANPVVVPGKLSSEICGKVWSNRVTNLEIGISNPDTVITELNLIFVINSPDGASADGMGFSFLNGFDTLFDVANSAFFLEGGRVMYVVHAITVSQGKGLPVTTDTIPYFSLSFRTPPFQNGLTICFDSTSSITQGDWSASPGPSLVWSGPACYQIFEPDATVPVFNFCPSTITGDSYCDIYSFQFMATDLEGDPVGYALISGPGRINPFNGLWTFIPTATDAGQTFSLVVAAGENLCEDSALERIGDQCAVTVSVGSMPPPRFQPGQNSIFVATSGDTLAVNFVIDNPDVCTPHRYDFYVEPGDPQPTGYLDSLSGTFYYTGTASDTGLYKINLILSAGSVADTNSFLIYHYDNKSCGDMDHDGAVDIADLTWLINYLFINFFPPPLPLASGNVDCTGNVDIADLTVLIDHLFINFPPLCSGC